MKIISLFLLMVVFGFSETTLSTNHTKDKFIYTCHSDKNTVKEQLSECRDVITNDLGNLYISMKKSENINTVSTYVDQSKQFQFFNFNISYENNNFISIINKKEYYKMRDTWLKNNGEYQIEDSNIHKNDYNIITNKENRNLKYVAKYKGFLGDFLTPEEQIKQQKDFYSVMPLIYYTDTSDEKVNKEIIDISMQLKKHIKVKDITPKTNEQTIWFNISLDDTGKQIIEQFYFKNKCSSKFLPIQDTPNTYLYSLNFITEEENANTRNLNCKPINIRIEVLVITNDKHHYYSVFNGSMQHAYILGYRGMIYTSNQNNKVSGGVPENYRLYPIMIVENGERFDYEGHKHSIHNLVAH